MAGIYIHIPFCRQACHYCNFHFSTTLKNKDELVAALLKETRLQKEWLNGETVETIYFGGGTPSILKIEEIRTQVETIRQVYNVSTNAEITLEANPDDITEEQLKGWKQAGINRLSIGIQSFFDEDLRWMNRAHTAAQAMDTLILAKQYFPNISIDLIYGSPALTDEKWKQNVDRILALQIPHISCYALTVEPKTALDTMIRQHKTEDVDPGKQSEQFLLLMQWLEEAGYEHYEISNFAKPGQRSRHNSSYWLGTSYLGLGPSAHSFNGTTRQWNIANNALYTSSIHAGSIPFEKEVLTPEQKMNEYIMTALRTMEGIDLGKVYPALPEKSRKFIENGLLKEEQGFLRLTREGKLLADGIASDLFL